MERPGETGGFGPPQRSLLVKMRVSRPERSLGSRHVFPEKAPSWSPSRHSLTPHHSPPIFCLLQSIAESRMGCGYGNPTWESSV